MSYDLNTAHRFYIRPHTLYYDSGALLVYDVTVYNGQFVGIAWRTFKTKGEAFQWLELAWGLDND
jgi:hypothetical protein